MVQCEHSLMLGDVEENVFFPEHHVVPLVTLSYLTQIRLHECLGAETLTNAHGEVVQNAFTGVARLLTCCA